MEPHNYNSMNSTEYIYRLANGWGRLIKWPLLCAVLSLALSRPALAASAAYTNSSGINYPVSPSSPPVIDATNFINNNQFIINFTTLSLVQPFYETWDTLNYTNRSLMMANTGFQFDDQSSVTSGLRTMSGTFYNQGTISCGSVNDTTATVLFSSPYYQCIVNATNILNPGIVDVGVDGMIQFTGQNVDLTRGRLTMESGGANVFGTGYFGLNTNSVTIGNTTYLIIPGWDPSVYLDANSAMSALVPIAPPSPVLYPFPVLYLTNSTAYFQIDSPNPSNNIVRSVFIEDTSGSNVTYNVYFDTAGIGFGGGNVTIEWTGSYQDNATGTDYNNYLYLNNNYLESVATNDGTLGSIPFNFTFTESKTKQIVQAPALAGFANVFPSGALTNRYAYMNAQLAAGTATPSQVVNLSVTNLPGRIQINASHELNLALAQISGPNYMSLQSTNQFDGSPGASIQVPYSDLNLGVTNRTLTVSNLLAPNLFAWSGTCQAWSTEWITTTTNTIVVTNGAVVSTNGITVTNDFRVLIVGSKLNPTTLAQVQDVILHGTNIVIGDALNLMRTFTSDAQSLTLTTNGFGKGATSLDGELNVTSPDFDWATALPNLRNLTNNGAIRFQNLNPSQFIGNSISVAVTPAVAATGTLSEVTNYANVLPLNKVLIGTTLYVFTNILNNASANQVKIGATFDGTMSNLIAAINATNGAGTRYSSSTVSNAFVTAGLLASHAFTVVARTNGLIGNSIQSALSTPTTNYLTWSSSYLVGGADAVTNASSTQVPYHSFINNGLLSDLGSQIWADNFESSGAISNGSSGSFVLQSLTATLTNGFLYAGGDVSITTGSLVTSNLVLEADRSLTLWVTNVLTDTGVTNGNVWNVGAASGGDGLTLPVLPATAGGGSTDTNSLLGTTITLFAPTNVNVVSTWAANDFGTAPAGYTNNVAIGHLILDALGPSVNAQFYFTGPGASNAIYVDRLELRDYASWTNLAGRDSTNNLLTLAINANMVIYYADAIAAGVGDVSERINHKNNDQLRWVPSYAGYFSSTNLVFAGVTNAVNVALATSTTIDSDGDGIANASDPTPFFLQSGQNIQFTNINANTATIISWNSIPSATNHVVYSPDLVTWIDATNFVSPSLVPPAGGWPIKYAVEVPYGSPVFVRDPIVTPNFNAVYGIGP